MTFVGRCEKSRLHATSLRVSLLLSKNPVELTLPMTPNSSSALPPLPSNRRFGALFTLVFALLAAYGAYKGWSRVATGGLGVIAAIFALLSTIAPARLEPLNRLWFKFGMLLGRIVSPIVLGLIFFLLITPVAMLGRAFGRDELKLRKRVADSYWVDRVPAGPPADSFKNMF